MFKNALSKYLKSRHGATAIEYALIATGIALAIALTVFAFGADLSVLYDSVVAIFTG